MATLYNSSVRWDVHHIPINQILMTKPIHKAIVQNGGSISGMGFKSDPNPAIAPLNRLHDETGCYQYSSMVNAMSSGVKFPPMELQHYRTIDGIAYYSIIQGRHRFSSSVIIGYNHVPAIIID